MLSVQTRPAGEANVKRDASTASVSLNRRACARGFRRLVGVL